jgi:hypothetical protein
VQDPVWAVSQVCATTQGHNRMLIRDSVHYVAVGSRSPFLVFSFLPHPIPQLMTFHCPQDQHTTFRHRENVVVNLTTLPPPMRPPLLFQSRQAYAMVILVIDADCGLDGTRIVFANSVSPHLPPTTSVPFFSFRFSPLTTFPNL